jgi:hypothetical protein
MQQCDTEGAESLAIDAALNSLFKELCQLTGLGSSVQRIAMELPPTTLDDEAATVCPELVFPTLAAAIVQRSNTALSLVERLQDLIKIRPA